MTTTTREEDTIPWIEREREATRHTHATSTDHWLRAESNWSRGDCVCRPVGLGFHGNARVRTSPAEPDRSLTIYDGQPRDRVTGYHGDRDLFSFGPYTSFVPLSGNRSSEVVNSRSKAFISYILYNASFFYFPSIPSPVSLSFPFLSVIQFITLDTR